MIYIDTSCLLKLVRLEPESGAVADALAAETVVVVSALCELEAVIQLKAGYLSGEYSLGQWRKLEALLWQLRNENPFTFRPVPGGAWENALRQHQNSGKAHCRTLDRLHLAIMEQFGIKRLMTHDDAQAKAAAALQFGVLRPGRRGK